MSMNHLISNCSGTICTNPNCPNIAAQGPNGRWYITMGHPGFNTQENNGLGYRYRESALSASVRLARENAGEVIKSSRGEHAEALRKARARYSSALNKYHRAQDRAQKLIEQARNIVNSSHGEIYAAEAEIRKLEGKKS